ncbi:MAG: transposase [Gemmataceae bacterium]|nr:transposase [Gemmataceae bacterium]
MNSRLHWGWLRTTMSPPADGSLYARVRCYLRRRKIKAVIPTRKDRRRRPGFDKPTYRRRNVVERCINWLKECRALATRFDKLAVNYLATVKLAILRQYLRKLAPADSSDRPWNDPGQRGGSAGPRLRFGLG